MDYSITLFGLLTLTIASAALLLSILNLWLSQLRRGSVCITHPTIFFFGWDRRDELDTPKIMLRSTLFSSGSRGRVLESMHILVRTADGQCEFPFWGYDDGKGMVRGSGLFVGPTGHTAYHHFNPLNDDHDFSFSGTEYEIEVWAKIFNQQKNRCLGTYRVQLTDEELVVKLMHQESGVLWTWSPQDREYSPESYQRPFEWPEKPLRPTS